MGRYHALDLDFLVEGGKLEGLLVDLERQLARRRQAQHLPNQERRFKEIKRVVLRRERGRERGREKAHLDLTRVLLDDRVLQRGEEERDGLACFSVACSGIRVQCLV